MISRKMSAFQALSWFKEVSLYRGKYVWTGTRDSLWLAYRRANSDEWLSFSAFVDHLHAIAVSEA